MYFALSAVAGVGYDVEPVTSTQVRFTTLVIIIGVFVNVSFFIVACDLFYLLVQQLFLVP